MKNTFKYIILAAAVVFGAASCEKFLNRPSEDSYTTADFYKNDAQIEQGINYLYNSPWYDIIRFYIYGSDQQYPECGDHRLRGCQEPLHRRSARLEGDDLFLPGAHVR